MAEEPKPENKKEENETADVNKVSQPISTKKLIIIMSSAFSLILLLVSGLLIFFLTKDTEVANADIAVENQQVPEATSPVEKSLDSKDTDAIDNLQSQVEKQEVKTDDKDVEFDSNQNKAIFYTIRPAFVVNFQGARKSRYLQVTVDVMARNDDVIDDVMDYLPLIKNDLISLFSSKKHAELQTADGRDKLRKEALKVIQDVLKRETGNPGIEEVLFTSFVIQ